MAETPFDLLPSDRIVIRTRDSSFSMASMIGEKQGRVFPLV
jgi:hypothetical protein